MHSSKNQSLYLIPVSLLALWLSPSGAAEPDEGAKSTEIVVSKAEPLPKHNFPGGVMGIPLGKTTEEPPTALFRDRRVAVLSHNGNWLALVGFGSKLSPKQMYRLKVIDSQQRSQEIPFRLNDKLYPTTKFNYPKKYHSFSESALKRINREKSNLTKIRRRFAAQAMAMPEFSWPTKGRRSSEFGVRRVFQNRTTTHRGLDIANKTGTSILATSAGVVALAQDYYFTGNTIVLEHGNGILSLYAHLDSMAVAEGEVVDAQQLLGRMGNTGRSTGPHLHFSIGLNGVWVDPALLLP